jgi:hypothetical protein
MAGENDREALDSPRFSKVFRGFGGAREFPGRGG